jgi:hypothetical protein
MKVLTFIDVRIVGQFILILSLIQTESSVTLDRIREDVLNALRFRDI